MISDRSEGITGIIGLGEIVGGKYRVDGVLGEGGMGVVVAARHLGLDQRVAIKFVTSRTARSPEVLARFSREARAAAQIDSDHVAKVLDVGELSSGVPYIVMEYLEGTDLAGVVEQRGPLPVEEAIDYTLQAGEALAQAHRLGIVHRDLKPANLFLARRGGGIATIKVLDFGVSKITASPDGTSEVGLTSTGAFVGSPAYMSPEQMRSARSVDARSDIWSLAVVLYELLTGTVPFDAKRVPELCAMILHDAPTPLRAHRSDVPPALEAVVLRALEKEPVARFANVAEFATALEAFASPMSRLSADRIRRISGFPAPPSPQSERSTAGDAPAPEVLPTVGVARPDSQSLAANTANAWDSGHPGKRKTSGRRFLTVSIAAAAIALAAFVIGGALRTPRQGPSSAAPFSSTPTAKEIRDHGASPSSVPSENASKSVPATSDRAAATENPSALASNVANSAPVRIPAEQARTKAAATAGRIDSSAHARRERSAAPAPLPSTTASPLPRNPLDVDIK